MRHKFVKGLLLVHKHIKAHEKEKAPEYTTHGMVVELHSMSVDIKSELDEQNKKLQKLLGGEHHHDLPPGWTTRYDASIDKTYYLNMLTRKRQLERPGSKLKAAVRAVQFARLLGGSMRAALTPGEPQGEVPQKDETAKQREAARGAGVQGPAGPASTDVEVSCVTIEELRQGSEV